MRRLKAGLLGGLASGLLGLLVGFLMSSFLFNTVTYEGKAVFQVESQYVEFKQVLARPEVEIEDIFVLSSSPPIIVKFLVTVPESYEFPYGEAWPPGAWFSYVVGGIAGALVGGLLVGFFYEED